MNTHDYRTYIPFTIEIEVAWNDLVTIEHTKTKTSKQYPTFIQADGKRVVRISCSVPGDYECIYSNHVEKFVVKTYQGNNPLYTHGPPTISAGGQHLQYEDGTPFFWLADTWWYGGTKRSELNKEFKQLLFKRVKQHFSVVQIVVGIPPEIDQYSDESQNLGGKPFLENWHINPAYFDEIDTKISLLVDNGIVPCIVGGWGNQIDWMGIEPMKVFWKEIIARYAAFPVVWCLTGEVDGFPQLVSMDNKTKQNHSIEKMVKMHLPGSLQQPIRAAKTKVTLILFRKQRNERINAWSTVAEFIKHHDPFHRLCCVHVSGQRSADNLFAHNHHLFSFNTIQSGHSKDSISNMIQQLLMNNQKGRAIVNMEPWYEGILGNFGPHEQRFAFWVSLLCGGIGHTYGAHGIWQMAHDQDNFMDHWGHSSWESAYEFKGAEHIGLAKHFLEQFEWWKLKPSFSCITPHWSTTDVLSPIAGCIEGSHVFVYFPESETETTYTLENIPLSLPYNASFINPTNMKILSSCTITDNRYQLTVPDNGESEDNLLIISADTL